MVDRSGDHHRFTGSVDRRDTPQMRVEGRLTTARRVAWEVEHGPLPAGARVEACVEPRCVRVDHLSLRPRSVLPAAPVDVPASPRRRRRRGEGSIRQVRVGVWKLTLSVPEPSDRGRRVSRTIHGTRPDAENAMALWLAERGGPACTLDGVVTAYLAQLDGNGRGHHTLRRYRQLWRDWLSPTLGRTHPDDVARADVEAALAAMGERGQSASSIRQAATVLTGCYAWAVADGRATANPTLRARLPDGSQITGARRLASSWSAREGSRLARSTTK